MAELAQLVDIGVQLNERRGAVVVGELGIVDADHAVGPVENELTILLGNAHDLGNSL